MTYRNRGRMLLIGSVVSFLLALGGCKLFKKFTEKVVDHVDIDIDIDFIQKREDGSTEKHDIYTGDNVEEWFFSVESDKNDKVR